MTQTFAAFTAEKTDDGFRRGLTELTVDDLPGDDVVVDVEWSSVNYKDHLAATEKGRVARISPLVPGIDLAGKVRSSDAGGVQAGDLVISHGYDLGVAHHGGYAQVARVPADWIVPLPDGLTTREAMVVGTAGYTAALSVLALLDHGLEPGAGTVLVTGATGGVGSMAVAMLAGLGFTVAASTGKPDSAPFLRGLGASEIVDRDELTDTSKPLLATRWAGAVDAVGGDDPRARARHARPRRGGGRERQRRWCRPADDGPAVHPPGRLAVRDRLGGDTDRPSSRSVGSDRHRPEARGARCDGAGRRPRARRECARRDRSRRGDRPLRRAAVDVSHQRQAGNGSRPIRARTSGRRSGGTVFGG